MNIVRRVGTAATLALVVAAAPYLAAGQALDERLEGLAAALSFEAPSPTGFPGGWGGGPPETILFDEDVVHSGGRAARIDRDADSANEFTALTMAIPADFEGEAIELRGYLRTEDVTGFAGFWLRVDAAGNPLAFDNMQDRQINGTTEWAEYRTTLPLPPEASSIVFGALLVGRGKAWVDDIELFVDGLPVADAPRFVLEPAVLETDTEFDAGSGIAVSALTPAQVENLVVLAKVWGFLKYHHLRVARGELHWDYELFRVLPEVLAAADAAERNRALLAWTARVGDPEPCDPCAEAPEDAHLLPEIDWIRNDAELGEALSSYLERVHRNRFAKGNQFYVAITAQGAANPIFHNEPAYRSIAAPDVGYRFLALFRFWNMIEYWFPYRDMIGEPWDGVLREFIPRLAVAQDGESYALTLAALIARINDTHAQLRGADVLPPRGECRMPIGIRFIEGAATVTAFSNEDAARASGVEIGDVIAEIAGNPVEQLVARWKPYHSASNDATKLRIVARHMTRGECGSVSVRARRGGSAVELSVERVPEGAVDLSVTATHDRPGDTFQRLGSDVAYIKLSTIREADIARYIEEARGTRGLVIDIRNYPSEFVVFALGQHLVEEVTAFAAFTRLDLANPGAFVWGFRPVHEPREPFYDGKVVILVDEATLSQAEYTAMALRVGPRAVVVGSTTSAADGNVSGIVLPGGIGTGMSGLGVFYPDGRPTQRVGIVPDVFVTPTVDGIRDGRDEVLERGLREILGDDADGEAIRDLARRPL